MNTERRKEKRNFRIIPIRYKKRNEDLFTVGDIVDFTDTGFCLVMPVGLDVDEEFEFEIFDGGARMKGNAHVVWMDPGQVRAGCEFGANQPKSRIKASHPRVGLRGMKRRARI